MGQEPDPAKIVRTFFSAYNDHDVELTLAVVAEDFVLRDRDSTFRMDRAQLAVMLGWDVVMQGVATIESLRVDGEQVHVIASETNEFQRLLDVPPWRLSARFHVSGELIREEVLEELPREGRTWQQALPPVVEWAQAHRPGMLHGIYENGSPVFSADSAKRWITLLRDWNATTLPPPPPHD